MRKSSDSIESPHRDPREILGLQKPRVLAGAMRQAPPSVPAPRRLRQIFDLEARCRRSALRARLARCRRSAIARPRTAGKTEHASSTSSTMYAGSTAHMRLSSSSWRTAYSSNISQSGHLERSHVDTPDVHGDWKGTASAKCARRPLSLSSSCAGGQVRFCRTT